MSVCRTCKRMPKLVSPDPENGMLAFPAAVGGINFKRYGFVNFSVSENGYQRVSKL